MSEFVILRDLVIIFAVALLVVPALRRLRVPAIAGLIAAGILVGPNALGLIGDIHQVETLAEVGVVLLMFGIGLELSLVHLRRMWRPILIGGTLQVGLTILVALLVARLLGLDTGPAVFLGCVVAVSSTAIVLRSLAARGELETPHGRFAVGILIYQDLAVLPMILSVPLLSQSGTDLQSVLLELLKGLLFMIAVLVAARFLAPRLLRLVARTRQRDLFILAVCLICFGTAWAASSVGISLALGAFLGGLIVAGSEFRHQALADMLPSREVLTSIFFVSVGMLLDLGSIVNQPALALGLLAAILLGKYILISLTALILRLSFRTSILVGVTLAQVGEFSFVLLRAAESTDLVPDPFGDTLLMAIILSMAITPVVISLGPHVASGVSRVTWLNRLHNVRAPEEIARQSDLKEHCIVAGFGLAGMEVSTALRKVGTACIVVDLNPENVRAATKEGFQACFGDVTLTEVLHTLGVERAQLLVVAINDLDAALRCVRAAHDLAPSLHIVARTAYAADFVRLQQAGAVTVIAAEIESANSLRDKVLNIISPTSQA